MICVDFLNIANSNDSYTNSDGDDEKQFFPVMLSGLLVGIDSDYARRLCASF